MKSIIVFIHSNDKKIEAYNIFSDFYKSKNKLGRNYNALRFQKINILFTMNKYKQYLTYLYIINNIIYKYNNINNKKYCN